MLDCHHYFKTLRGSISIFTLFVVVVVVLLLYLELINHKWTEKERERKTNGRVQETRNFFSFRMRVYLFFAIFLKTHLRLVLFFFNHKNEALQGHGDQYCLFFSFFSFSYFFRSLSFSSRFYIILSCFVLLEVCFSF